MPWASCEFSAAAAPSRTAGALTFCLRPTRTRFRAAARRPITSSDWISLLPVRTQIDYSSTLGDIASS
jgi:hypothetical protein